MLIRDTADLDEESRRAAEQAMAEAGFAFDVLAILDVREEFEIFSWTVQTEQGPRQFQTARDEWPRELPNGDYVVRDVASDLYVVRDPDNLDPRSRAHFWEMVD
jgi:hypothetical protein